MKEDFENKVWWRILRVAYIGSLVIVFLIYSYLLISYPQTGSGWDGLWFANIWLILFGSLIMLIRMVILYIVIGPNAKKYFNKW